MKYLLLLLALCVGCASQEEYLPEGATKIHKDKHGWITFDVGNIKFLWNGYRGESGIMTHAGPSDRVQDELEELMKDMQKAPPAPKPPDDSRRTADVTLGTQ